MPLTRRAIIISAGNIPGQLLPGAVKDLENYMRFLRSPYGGTWLPDEILPMPEPDIAKLNAALTWARLADYSFITFSGHGEHHVGQGLNDTSLILNAREQVYVYQLSPGNLCKRQTVVVDACRKERILKSLLTDSAGLRGMVVRAAFSPPDPAKCRAIFDKHVAEAEEGRVNLFSCGINQTAGEDQRGGFFSRLLVEHAHQAVEDHPGPAWFGLDKAFAVAQAKTNEYAAPQMPESGWGRRLTHFPFAVIAR